MIELTKKDYEEIISEIGSDHEPFNNAEEFINWLEKNQIDGQQLALIEKYLKDNFSEAENIKIYNKKEGRSAVYNAIQRLRVILLNNTENSNGKEGDPNTIQKIKDFIFGEKNSEKSNNTEKTDGNLPEKSAPEPKTEPQEKPEIIDYAVLRQAADEYFSQAGLPKEDEDIDCTERNIHYDGRSIMIEDEIGLMEFDSSRYSTNIILIADSNGKIAATGGLKKVDYYRIFTVPEASENGSWGTNSRFNVIVFPVSADKYISMGEYSQLFSDSAVTSDIRAVHINIKSEADMPESDSPLCIDFGTSNTTAGYFVDDKDDEKRFVPIKFFNTIDNKNCFSEIIPTVLYVKRCFPNMPEKNQYLFGFDAQKAFIEQDFMPDASIFFELKRWLGIAPEEKVELTDENFEHCEVTYFSLIKAYLMYIIGKAEDNAKMRFRNLHLTSPVKLKENFIKNFNKMFTSPYKIETAPFDEGISVIYETVRNNIRHGNDFTDTNMMVIDCGGGTTDVASCKIKRSTENGIETLDISTDYLGGDTNYGGNNITYRIMQFVKIKLAFYYKKASGGSFDSKYSVFLKEILPSPDDILNIIDRDYTSREVYRKLEEEYAVAEGLIPTRFGDNNELTKANKKKKKIRRNFYYLWNLAEQIKKEFYKKDHLTLIGFNDLSDQIIDANYENILEGSKLRFSLYIRNGDTLEERTDLPQISITAQEVDDLIRGDIYALLSRIFYNGENTNYLFYRFSGQSCRIRLFGELMKEFIPGKKMRDNTDALFINQSDKTLERLKTSCIKGTVYYEYDTKHGNIRTELPNRYTDFRFSVYTDFNGREDCVLDQSMVKLFPITEKTELLTVSVKNRFGEITNDKTPVKFSLSMNTHTSSSIEKTLSKRTTKFYTEKILHEISSAKKGRYCFIYPMFGYELYAVVIDINDESGSREYKMSSSHLIAAEKSSYTFFDGTK